MPLDLALRTTGGRLTHLCVHAISESLFPALASPCAVHTSGRTHSRSSTQSTLHLAGGSMRDYRSTYISEGIPMQNVHYKRDIRYAMRLCQWILKPIGIWHFVYGRSSLGDKLLSLVLILLCFSLLCFVFVPVGYYIIMYEKDLYVKVKLFGPIGFCLNCAIKYYLLGANRTAIGRCVRHVEDDWRVVRYQNYRDMMLKNALVSRRLSSLCAIFLYSGGMSYHSIMPLSAKTSVNGSVRIRPMVYPGYDQFFDSQASPAYEIVFGMHCLCAMVQYNVTTAVCSLAATFVTHACGQVQILMTMLGDLVEGNESEHATVEKRLSAIASHHVRVLR